MRFLSGAPAARAARLIGFPSGIGELIPLRSRPRLLLSLAGSIGLAILDMLGVIAMLPLMQYVTGQSLNSGMLGVFDRALGQPSTTVLVSVMAAVIVAAFVVKDVAALAFLWWQLRFMADLQVDMSARILEGYLTGPYVWHVNQNTGDKVWTVQGAVAIGYSNGLSAALGAVTESLTILLIFGSLMVISPVVTAAALLYFGLAGLLVQRIIRPRVLAASHHNMVASQAVSRSSLQSLSAAKEIKLRRAHGPFVTNFKDASRDGAYASATASVLGQMPKYFLEIVFVFGVGLLAAFSTAQGTKGLVLLGVFVAAGTRILPSAVRLINEIAAVRFSVAPLTHLIRENRMQEVARADEQAAQRTDAEPHGDIEIRGVQFGYGEPPHPLVLKGVDLSIHRGTSLALVGSSGAGKTTLVDILLGLHNPTRGAILAGGVDISHNLPAWQKKVAVVPQDVVLLDDSLRRNIAFDETVDEARLQEAVHRAQLAELVDSLPEGLDSQVGERGARLSGGQRQRIGIARALYRRPEVLFLDEATSALDNETEHRLTGTIEQLSGTVTMIIVAHRLSTVRHCDTLAFMSSGTVEAIGTFDEVAAQSREFAALVRLGSLTLGQPEASEARPIVADRESESVSRGTTTRSPSQH